MSAVLARARVLRVMGDRMLVESVERGCGRCDEPGGCGGRGLESLKARVVEVGNPLGACVGDYVELSVPGEAIVGLASRVYLLPLAGLIGGALLGGDSSWALVASLSGAALGFLAARWSLQRHRLQPPSVVRVCANRLEKTP